MLRTALAILVGVAIGLGAAAAAVRGGLSALSATSGPWSTSAVTGSADAGLFTRAAVAAGGLLALSAKEAVYFTAASDAAGAPLDGHCTYLVTGRDPKARWWSITLYGADHYLVQNREGRFSFHMQNVPRTGGGGFAFEVGPAGAAGRFLPTGGVERFSLTLRAYNPDPRIIGRPDRARLPSIERLSC